MKRNINYQFLFLKTIGIILVVSGHVGNSGGITLFTDWFPASSFHIPLFVFISGYFYKINNDMSIINYISDKFKKLLKPYYEWNLVYGIIITILLRYNIVYFGSKINPETFFIDPWKHGHQYAFNLAAWFVIDLFIIQIFYAIFRKNSKYVFNNEYFLMFFFILIGCLGVVMSNNGLNTGWYLPLVRTMFLLPFYHLGYLYKTKLKHIDKLNSVIYFLILFIIQFILTTKYNQLYFTVAWCNNFNKANILLPYITSITGIMFWLRVSKILEPSIRDSKIIQYIGSNTWTVMMHHLFILFLINALIARIVPIFGINGFDFNSFKSSIWYSYIPAKKAFLFFYLIAGVSIPLIIKYYSLNLKIFFKYKLRQLHHV